MRKIGPMPWKKIEPMDQRLKFCCKALRGGNCRALCREYGISAKTGYKWQERFLRDGASGMERRNCAGS
jgi:transposase